MVRGRAGNLHRESLEHHLQAVPEGGEFLVSSSSCNLIYLDPSRHHLERWGHHAEGEDISRELVLLQKHLVECVPDLNCHSRVQGVVDPQGSLLGHELWQCVGSNYLNHSSS